MPHQCTNCGRTFSDGSKEMLSGCPDCGGNKFQFAPANTASRTAGGPDPSSPGDPDPAAESGGVTETATDTVSRAAETVRDWVSDSDVGSDSDAGPDASSSSRANDDRSRPRSRPWPETGESDSEGERDQAGRRSTSQSFPEWPDTARPPADRSNPKPTSTSTGSSRSESAPSSSSDGPTSSSPTASTDEEDTAQADARSAVVTPDELPDPSDSTATESGTESGTTTATPVDEDRRTSDSVDVEDRPDHGRVVSEPSGERPSLEELREELNDQFESIKILKPGQYELNLMELYDREEYIVSLQEDGRYVIDVPDSWLGDE